MQLFFTMKKEYRVKRNEDFQKIIQSGKSKANRSFVMYYAPAAFSHDRVGLSVGKKMGDAVHRNKVKRQVRMMVQEIFSFDTLNDYIIIVRVNYNNKDCSENKKDLLALYNSVYNKKGQSFTKENKQ